MLNIFNLNKNALKRANKSIFQLSALYELLHHNASFIYLCSEALGNTLSNRFHFLIKRFINAL